MRPPARRGRIADPVLFAGGVVLLGLALALLGHAGVAVWAGVVDARPKHGREPMFLHAADEPVWFYAIILGLVALAILVLVVAWRMLRHAHRPR